MLLSLAGEPLIRMANEGYAPDYTVDKYPNEIMRPAFLLVSNSHA